MAALTASPAQSRYDAAQQRVSSDSTVAALNERYAAGKEMRRIFENDWLLCLSFGMGQQWVGVDPSGMIFDALPGDDRVTITDNRMRPASRSNIARLTKTAPNWQGVPKDGSDVEIARARMRSYVFEHYWRELEFMRRLRLVLWYREHCGIGFLKTTWDQAAGDVVRVMALKGGPVLMDTNNRPLTIDRVAPIIQRAPDEERTQLVDQLEERQVSLGDANLQLKTPWEIVVDPLATDEGLSTAEYIIEEAIYSPAVLRRLIPGVDPDALREDGSPADSMLGRFPGMSTYLERSRERRGGPGRRGIKVREYWSLPGVDGPRGKHVIWTVQGRLLLEDDNLYPFLPYTDFRGLPAGRFYPQAPLWDGISPQVGLNKSESQIAENAERFGNPARARSAESIDTEYPDWQGLPGEEIVYHDLGTAGSIPQFITPPQMPQYAIQLPEMYMSSLNAVFGQSEVAQGTVPEGVTAASAISQLMEANETMFGPDVGDVGDSVLDVGRKILWCAQKWATGARLARIAGEDAQWDVIEFQGEELGDASADGIEIASGIKASTAVRQAGIQWVVNTLIQNGQAPPPRELRRIMQDYEVGGLEHVFASLQKTQTQVAEEHRRMLRGELVPINDYDDDSTHIAEHEDYFRGSRFQQLALKPGGPLIQGRMLMHLQLHKQRAQNAANQQAASQVVMQAAAKGNGPGLDPGALATATGEPPAAAPGTVPPDGALPSPAGPPPNAPIGA